MTKFPTTLDVDGDCYPSDARLDEIRAADAMLYGADFMVNVFPKLCAELKPYAYCEVTEVDDEWNISLSTSGWSVCEDFIDAVLDNQMIRLLYYYSWQRGGRHEFRVPKDRLK